MSVTDVVIVGAGILGLSIATELSNRGLKVAIVAKDLPEDIHSVGFASPWAGCNWCSFADDNLIEQEWDKITFLKFAALAPSQPELCEMIKFYDVWDEKDGGEEPWFKSLVPNFKNLGKNDEIPGKTSHGITFESYVLHAPNYIAYLADNLRQRGVPFIRQRLASLDEAYSLEALGLGKGNVDLVVNATGLGAKSLLGVADDSVYPIRGQTVLVRAPDSWKKVCVMKTETHPTGDPAIDNASPEPSYIIPRPGSSRDVILGGSFQIDDFNTLPDLSMAERILKKAFILQPGLAKGGSWKDIEVIKHNVGLRPARRGGCRVELERRKVGVKVELAPPSRMGKERVVGVVHAYGIGPAGYQASLGIAEKASDMVMTYLKDRSVDARL